MLRLHTQGILVNVRCFKVQIKSSTTLLPSSISNTVRLLLHSGMGYIAAYPVCLGCPHTLRKPEQHSRVSTIITRSAFLLLLLPPSQKTQNMPDKQISDGFSALASPQYGIFRLQSSYLRCRSASWDRTQADSQSEGL